MFIYTKHKENTNIACIPFHHLRIVCLQVDCILFISTSQEFWRFSFHGTLPTVKYDYPFIDTSWPDMSSSEQCSDGRVRIQKLGYPVFGETGARVPFLLLA
jgi:hypothetical protein